MSLVFFFFFFFFRNDYLVIGKLIIACIVMDILTTIKKPYKRVFHRGFSKGCVKSLSYMELTNKEVNDQMKSLYTKLEIRESYTDSKGTDQ